MSMQQQTHKLKPPSVNSAQLAWPNVSARYTKTQVDAPDADESSTATDLAKAFSLPYLELESVDLSQCPDKVVDSVLLRRHRVLPLFLRTRRLYLAVADPRACSAFDEIKFHCGYNLELVVVDRDKLEHAVKIFSEKLDESRQLLSSLTELGAEELVVEAPRSEEPAEQDAAVDEAPIVRFVNKLLLDANKAQVSDIHIEPYERNYRVRFRIDGVLKEVAHPPIKLASRIASRIKVMALMDISERRLPQDGRIKIRIANSTSVEFRVNSIPTLWGEKIVLRLLASANSHLDIDSLGFNSVQKQLYLQALQSSQGLILVTGPTGSGKTVSLYTGLNILNTSSRNISAAEDPVEINLEGINQLSINPRTGMTFARAMRAFLRQDPDVIMLGEIRDTESAEIALKAAQTGHLVLSTLHTNSAWQSLSRLLSMGISPYNLSSCIKLIIAQRLARKLCNHCKESAEIPENILIEQGFMESELDQLQIFTAIGCQHCSGGYLGRIGIYEVVPISQQLSPLIMEPEHHPAVKAQLEKLGVQQLRRSALSKVGQGIISLEEANRLT